MMVVLLLCLIADPGTCKRVNYIHPGVLSVATCASVIRQAKALMLNRSKWKVEAAMCLRRDMA